MNNRQQIDLGKQGSIKKLPLSRAHRSKSVRAAKGLNALSFISSFLIILGALISWIATTTANDPLSVFTTASHLFGVALGLSYLVEAQGGIRNLVRVDVLMLFALYVLTFFEFLFPQDQISSISVANARSAVAAVLVSFVGIVLGRHLFPLRVREISFAYLTFSPRVVILLMAGCLLLGHLYMLLAVNFDILEMIHQMQRPRFTQPWTRGRYGSLSTLLNEFGLLVFIIPPLAGVVLARGERFNWPSKIFTATVMIFILFEGFAGGTRYVFLVHVATFVAAYAILTPRLTVFKALKIGVPALLISIIAMQALLLVRSVGIVGLEEHSERATDQTVFVDMNLVNIAKITSVIPAHTGYLGLEIPWIAIIRPIPRAFWPGKPEELSFSVNDATGVGDYMTVSASFPGELWMAGGYLAIALGSFVAGVGAGYWNRFGARARSSLQLVAYVLGFFPACLMMRSFLSSAPAFLPLIALLIYLKWFSRARSRS